MTTIERRLNMEYLIQKERVELFAPNLDIEVVAEIEGSIQEGQLAEAVESAVRSQELLQCKIVINDQGEAFYTKADSPKIIIHSFKDDWTKVIIEQEKKPFDLERGELVRFFAKYKENGVQLLIIAHHLAGDGLAVTYLLEDIINALNGFKLKYKEMTLFDVNSLPKDSRINPMFRLIFKRTNKNWRKTGKVFTFTDYRSMFQKYWNNHNSDIACEHIEPETVNHLKTLAKQHNITVNSLLTTIILQAQKEINDIGITVRLTPKNGEIRGNQSTAVSIKYVYDETKDFWANAIIVHKMIYQKLNRNKDKYFLMQFLKSLSPTLIDASYFAAFDDYDNKMAVSTSNMFGYRENGKKNIGISNLTTVDFTLAAGRFSICDITFVPPIAANSEYMIGMITYQDKLNLTFHTVSDEKSLQQKKIIQNALITLKNL